MTNATTVQAPEQAEQSADPSVEPPVSSAAPSAPTAAAPVAPVAPVAKDRRGSKRDNKGGNKGDNKGGKRGVKKDAKRLQIARAALARFQKKDEQGVQGRVGDQGAALSLADAVAALCAMPRVKFDETLEVAMNLGIDPRHADQQVRGTISLPHGTGKTLRVAVFARDEKAEQARKAGADIVGAEDLAERIQKGELPFDRCIATPDMMGLVGRLGKILGPRNLMPNPKLGTVAANVTAAVEAAKGGEVQFRAEKNGVVHAGIGRMSFSESQLNDNVLAFTKAVIALKPEGAKGTYVKKITLATTMGLGISVDVRSIANA